MKSTSILLTKCRILLFATVLALMFLVVQSQFSTKSTIFDEAQCPTEDDEPCVCKNVMFDSDTKNDIGLCKGEPLCVLYHQTVLRSRQSRSSFVVRNVTSYRTKNATGYTSIDATNTITYDGSDYKRYVKHSNLDEFLENLDIDKTKANYANFAPWHYVINHDHDRNPQDILETECIFSVCLNLTRNGFAKNYKVHPIMVTRYFTLNETGTNKILNAEFSIGCFCEISSAALTN